MERGERPGRRRLLFGLIIGALVLTLTPREITDGFKLGVLNVLRPVHWFVATVKEAMTIRRVDPKLQADLEFSSRRIQQLEMKLRESRALDRDLRALESVDWEAAFEAVPCDVVIPRDASPFRDTMIIARGSNDGIVKGAIVIHQQYVVGLVDEVSAFTSRLILISDPAFKIGALCMRMGPVDGKDSEVGIAQGEGDGMLRVRWISDPRGLEPGDFAITTHDPLAGIPKGLLLGRITIVDRAAGPYATVAVRAGMNGNLLERVQVLLPKVTE